MKKKIILIVSTIAIVASLVFVLVACNSNPAGFFEKAQDAKEMTATSYGDDGKVIGVMSINEKGEFITEAVCAKYTGGDLYLYVKTGETWKKAKIDDKHPLYLTTKASIDVLDAFNFGDMGISFQEEAFKEKDGLWYISSGGIMIELFGMKVSGDKLDVYLKEGDKMVKRGCLELKANIKLPEGASSATLVSADELK